jgi:integrase
MLLPMSRPSSLKPTEIASRKTSGLSAWCVNVPAHLSDTGKRRQLFFETKGEASTQCEALKARADNFGNSLLSITPARIAEAAEAYKMLDPIGIGLLDAIKSYVASHKTRTASIPFIDLFNLYLEAKKDRNEQYRRELRVTRDRFPQFHSLLVSDISYRDLEQPLMKISPGGRNPVMRYLRAVFNYGIKRGYLIENPISRLDFAERPRKEVETLSNKQVEAMLKHALAEDLPLLPFLVLGLFCGVRPDGELQKVEWKDIGLADKIVTIRPDVSKTKRRRFIDLSDNAKGWLETFMARSGIQRGRIVGDLTESELRSHRTANWKRVVGVTEKGKPKQEWLQQGMRHTYCSNWLAEYQDINKLVLMSGHDSVDTMFRHYHRGTPKAEAEKFWQIAPPAEAQNIVRFA